MVINILFHSISFFIAFLFPSYSSIINKSNMYASTTNPSQQRVSIFHNPLFDSPNPDASIDKTPFQVINHEKQQPDHGRSNMHMQNSYKLPSKNTRESSKRRYKIFSEDKSTAGKLYNASNGDLPSKITQRPVSNSLRRHKIFEQYSRMSLQSEPKSLYQPKQYNIQPRNIQINRPSPVPQQRAKSRIVNHMIEQPAITYHYYKPKVVFTFKSHPHPNPQPYPLNTAYIYEPNHPLLAETYPQYYHQKIGIDNDLSIITPNNLATVSGRHVLLRETNIIVRGMRNMQRKALFIIIMQQLLCDQLVLFQ